MSATVEPAGATDKSVTWSVENGTGSATINATGLLMGITEGIVTVKATANDASGVVGTLEVTVVALAPVTYTVTFDKNGGETEANPQTKTATYGGNVGALPTASTKIGHTFTGWNTQADGGGTAFTEVTAVTGDITVYAQWAVNVTGVSLNKVATTLAVGVTETLTTTVTPDNASNKTVSWSSSDEAIATVDAVGLVTAVAAGTVTITVTTADGG